MKFWEKFWKLVSVRDMVFVTVLFALAIALSMLESANRVKVTFDDDAVDVKAKRYSMNIPYDMVERIELVEMPEKGNVVEGSDDMSLRTGNWENETWGSYYVCADLAAANCIAVHLDDGRIFVFSSRSNQKTSEDFARFQSYLE